MEPTDHGAAEKVRAARARAAFLRWYFRHALYALVPRESRMAPTMGVDQFGRLYYNPAFVASVSVEELATVMLHEIGHVLRRHHERARALGVTEATQDVMNIASDCELNDDLRDEIKSQGDLAPLPGKPWLPADIGCPDHQVWEVYYAHIMDHAEKLAAEIEEQQQAGEGNGAESQQGKSGGGDEGKDGQGKSGSGQGKSGQQQGQQQGKGGKGGQKPKSGSGSQGQSGGSGWNGRHKCGSAAHGVRQPWEDASPSSGGGEGVDNADWRDIEKRVAKDIRESVQKSRGSVPGGWVEWADEVLRPVRIPWEQEIAGEVRWAINDVAGMVIHTYRRPSRRQSAVPDILLPSMRRPVPVVAIVGDTSGSMSEEDLALVRGTVSDIAQAMGATVAFIATDAAVHGGVQRVHDGRHAVLAGRGGTDMRVGIECALTEVTPRPDVIVVITDTFTPWPEEEPPVRVIVAAVRPAHVLSIESFGEAIAGVPEWAKVVVVHKDEAGL